MDRKLTIGGVLQRVVAYGLLLVFLLAWPLQIIKQPVISGNGDRIRWDLPPVYQTAEMVHEFKPQFDYLESISFYINNEWEDGAYISISCYLIDQRQELVMGEEFLLDASAYPGYFTIPVNQYVNTSENYVYLVHAQNVELSISSTEINETGAIESLKTYVNNEEQEGVYAATTFTYKTPVMWPWVIAYALCSVFFVVIIGIIEQKIFAKKELVAKYSQDGVIKVLLRGTIVIGTIVSIWAVYPMKIFGKSALDNGVYILGILLAGGFSLYITQKVLEPTKLWMTICDKKKIRNYVQSFCIGMAFIQTCQYVNATFNYTHYINSRQMVVWLLLALLTMIDPKQFITKLAWIFTGIGICSGIAYYVCYGIGIESEASALVLWDAYQLCLGVIILYHFARMLFTKKITKLSIPFVSLLVYMWTLLLLFHQERTWMILWIFPIGLFYGMAGQEEDTTDFLSNLRNGIFMSFLWVIGFSLIHRPFHNFIFIRYPLYFHTVTITATYLSMVLMVALAQTFSAYRKKSKGLICSSLFLLSMATSYLIFTITRTGIVASILTGFVLIVCVIFLGKQRDWAVWSKCICGSVIAVVCSLPIWFTATRTIPAIVNDPVRTEVEHFLDEILKGEPIDSKRYITLERFLTLMNIRLGVNEEINNQDLLSKQEEPSDTNTIKQESSVSANSASINHIQNEENISVEEKNESAESKGLDDHTNGRVTIWKAYLEALNWNGHKDMGVDLDGQITIHAHNSFIQVLHDHGLLTGIFFCIFCVMIAVRSLFYYLSDAKTYKMLIPLGIIGAFGIVSMVEWVIHPCMPIGLGFLMSIAPLMKKIERK